MILMEDFMNANASDVHVSCCLLQNSVLLLSVNRLSSAGLDPFTAAWSKNSAARALPHSSRIHLNEFCLHSLRFSANQRSDCER